MKICEVHSYSKL